MALVSSVTAGAGMKLASRFVPVRNVGKSS